MPLNFYIRASLCTSKSILVLPRREKSTWSEEGKKYMVRGSDTKNTRIEQRLRGKP